MNTWSGTVTRCLLLSLFFFHAPATTEIYTLSLTTLFRSLHRKSVEGDWKGMADLVTDEMVETYAVTGTWEDIGRSEEHTSELQSPCNLVCRLLLEKKKKKKKHSTLNN